MSTNLKHLPSRSSYKFCLIISVILGLTHVEARADKLIWNEYSSITQVFNADSSDLDSVRVTHPELFTLGDTVMFIQMKGAKIFLPPLSSAGKINTGPVYGGGSSVLNTGVYVLMLVSDILGDIIQFSDPLPYMNPPIPGEVNQLVKVKGARSIKISAGDTLSCKPWDAADSTGGVVVLLASESITLDGTIDVSGKGFHGGDTIPNEYTGDCVATIGSGIFLYEDGADSAGYKGEGVIYNGFPFVRGDGYVANAGGGGNGKYSGGGGGGNLGQGGLGGYQAEECGPIPNIFQGGFIQSFYYTNTSAVKNRIFMGGGGGAGTMNRPLDKIGTQGGNGGGLIILITDTLISNNSTLTAAGQSVTDTATAGAGGGGGGGVVVLAVDRYVGSLDINVSGGDGGWTNDPINKTGPGGFGGGGVIWHSGDTLLGNVNKNISNGAQGEWKAGIFADFYGTQNSSSFSGGIRDSLIVPIRGFTFNILFGKQEICEGEAPDTVIASFPKGDIEFNYNWLQWKESTGWTDADGVNNQKDYFPGIMTDTTHYRRVVEAVNNGTVDTSEVYRINVLDKLVNNLITSSDTICFGLTPSTLVHNAGTVAGGDLLNYNYIWESSPVPDPEDPVWISVGVNDPDYGPGALTDTTYFRRILYSHVCYDTSNVLTQTVLAPISGNTTTGNDALICHDEDPGTLVAGAVSGGEPGVYSYLWEESNDQVTWTGIATTPDYSTGNLQDNNPFYYYRRTVYSGGDDSTCVHTSDTVTIQVHPRIQFNWLSPALDTVCEDIFPGNIDPDGTIEGGNEIFTYSWEQSNDESAWTLTGAGDVLASYAVPPLSDTTWYRRIANSGACTDTSANTKYIVHSKISNNLVADNDTICYGEQPTPLIHGAAAVSGALGSGTYTYLWLARTDAGAWATAGGTNNNPDYTPGSLNDTVQFIRIIESGKCSDTSNQLQVIVQTDIGNNIIEGGAATGEACSDLRRNINGAQPAGGDNTAYTYLWQASLTGSGSWADATAANTGMVYLTEVLTDTMDYRRLVSSGVCQDTSSIVTLRVNPRPRGSVTGDPALTACYFGSTPISLDVPVSFPVGEPPFTIYYHDGQNPGTINGYSFTTGVFTLDLITDDSTQYVITIDSLLDSKGCWSYHPDSLPGMANALVFKYPIPVSSSDTVTVCADNTVLPATGDVGAGSWGPADALYSFSPADQPASTFTTTFTNDTLFYTVVWSEKNGICPVNDTSVVVVVELYEDPDPAMAGLDSTIYFASIVPLWADSVSAGLGTWSVEGTAVIDPEEIHLPNALVDFGNSNLDQPVDNTFTWTIQNGTCTVKEASVLVSRQDIKLFSGFSPNGDLFNQYFELPGLEYADEFDMRIFSRQGIVVRTISKAAGQDLVEPDMWWDGLLDNGQEAQDGTYFYILVVKHAGQTYEYKGFIELVRSGIAN